MKRISASTVTVAVVAVLLGLVAAYVARRALEPKTVKRDPLKAVVPKVNVPQGQRIRLDDLAMIPLPADIDPSNLHGAPAVVAGRYAKRTLVAGQPIRKEALFPIGHQPSVADHIEPGHRALPITVDGTSELIRPGARVDVSYTLEGDHPDLGGPQGIGTKTIMKNIHVLAVTQGRQSRIGGSSDSTLTVSVTPEQANKLIVAQRTGTLSATLRGKKTATEIAEEESRLINKKSLLGLKDPPAPVEPEKPQPYEVEVWEGGRMRVLKLSRRRVAEADIADAAAEKHHDSQPVDAGATEIRSEDAAAKEARLRRGRRRQPTTSIPPEHVEATRAAHRDVSSVQLRLQQRVLGGEKCEDFYGLCYQLEFVRRPKSQAAIAAERRRAEADAWLVALREKNE